MSFPVSERSFVRAVMEGADQFSTRRAFSMCFVQMALFSLAPLYLLYVRTFNATPELSPRSRGRVLTGPFGGSLFSPVLKPEKEEVEDLMSELGDDCVFDKKRPGLLQIGKWSSRERKTTKGAE
ncbi:hypothetical protein WMY93_019391 [Mugilogobius chulae]|uniref:Transmembrane protein n=1 Tax=Mugilogobius chulae TaxID=88201 RepID=A0AAW0NFE3_9GOBI